MATTFIEGIGVRPGRTPLITARDSIGYIINPEKTDGGKLVTAYRCSPETAHFEIMMEQHEFEQQTGRKVIQNYKDGKQSYMLMTMRQSFAPGEVTPEQAHEIGCKLAERILGGKYQYVVATHINTHCIHNHITFNIVGSDLKKFRQTKYTHKHLAEISDKLCEEYGLAVVVPSPEWQKRKYTNEKQTPFREILKADIDHAVETAQSYEEFLKLMEQNYRLDDQGKYLKFRHRTNGQQRYIRSYSLGTAYTAENIRARISGRFVEMNPVQHELQDDKPASYSQKLRNVKAMLNASGFVHEYGTDFDSVLDDISKQAAETKLGIDSAQHELAKVNYIIRCLDTVERNRPVAEEYEAALLKERFKSDHQDELEMYYAAIGELQKDNINLSGPKAEFSDSVHEIQYRLDQLTKHYGELQSQIDAVNQVRQVISRVQNDEQIITDRKRGRNYGR